MKPAQKPLVIWVLDDGKPGHRNQSLGLAEAIERLVDTEIHLVSLPHQSGFFSRIKSAREQAKLLPKPQLIIAAGHRTHIPLIYLTCKTKARSVVLMRPSLPTAWFDHCLVPEHDMEKEDKVPDNVILTKGALNRVAYDPEAKDGSGLFLIGGESSEFGFDGDGLHRAICEIVEQGGDREWLLTDSRRTPGDFISTLDDMRITLHPHQATGPDWLPRQLRCASVVWVTEDSVSMIYEALSSGAQVGLLPMPRIGKAGRVARGIKALIEDGRICHYQDWRKVNRFMQSGDILKESDRCASQVLKSI